MALNNFGGIIKAKKGFPDRISFWLEAYFRFEVTARINKLSDKIFGKAIGSFPE